MSETAGPTTPLVVYEDGHVDPPLSHVMVGLPELALLLGFVLLVAQALRARRRGRDAEAALDPEAPLRAGETFVVGTVELAREAPCAVRVRIEQAGTETHTKSGWTHRWAEYDRETEAHPFYLRHPSGERIRVEPGAEPLLVDAVDAWEQTGTLLRTGVAELSPGERCIGEGLLERAPDPERRDGDRGYRDMAQGWVLRPAEGERLHLSTEPLGRRHRLRFRGLLKAAVIGLGIALGAQLFVGTYLARLFVGERIRAEVESKRHYTTRTSRGGTNQHWEVVARWPVSEPQVRGWERYAGDLDELDWQRAREGRPIWVRHVEGSELARGFGAGSSVPLVLYALFLLAAFVTLGIWGGALRHRRWYEGKLVHTGSGRLPAPEAA